MYSKIYTEAQNTKMELFMLKLYEYVAESELMWKYEDFND